MAIIPFFYLSPVRFQGIIRRCVHSGGGVLKWTTRADCKSIFGSENNPWRGTQAVNEERL